MKKLIAVLAAFLVAHPAAPQFNQPSPITAVTSAPAGSCTANQGRLVGPGGTIYTCQNGTWTQIAASGAPPTGAAGGCLSGTYPNPGSSPCLYAAGGGTAQAQTATYSPAVTLTAGQWACWLPLAANSGAAPTFAPNGLTAHTIVKAGGTALAANDIITTAVACVVYDTTGTHWELQNPQTTAINGAPVPVSQSYVGTNGSGQIIAATAPYTIAQPFQITPFGTDIISSTGGTGLTANVILCQAFGLAAPSSSWPRGISTFWATATGFVSWGLLNMSTGNFIANTASSSAPGNVALFQAFTSAPSLSPGLIGVCEASTATNDKTYTAGQAALGNFGFVSNKDLTNGPYLFTCQNNISGTSSVTWPMTCGTRTAVSSGNTSWASIVMLQ